MSNIYTTRNPDLNMTDIIGIRVLKSQKNKLSEYAVKHNLKVSDIMREAITMWLNMNAKE